MLKVGITGGIGSGKSYVCRMLEDKGYPVFDCDREAYRLMHTQEALRRSLCQLVGREVYGNDGMLCKPVMSAFIRRNEESAAKVNALVHPRVRDAFIEMSAAYAALPPGSQPACYVMECALLYEAHFDELVDISVHVAATQEVRIKRLMARDQITPETARRWMALQMEEEEKRRRADIIVENNGNMPPNLDELLSEIRRSRNRI